MAAPPMPKILGLAAGWLAAGALAAPHVHGRLTLDIAVEPGRLTLQLTAPQEALLGHERAPRSAAERQAASALLERLRGKQPLWLIDPGLRCTLQRAEVDAPRLESAAGAGTSSGDSEHAELSATYEYACAGEGALRQLDLGPLLDAFKGVVGVDARIVGPGSQTKASLRRPSRLLGWSR